MTLPMDRVIPTLEKADAKIRRLSEERQILEMQLAQVDSTIDAVQKCLQTLKSSKSKNYLSLLSKRLKDMQEGTITLSVDDYFQFWTDIHMKDEIYAFKVTSRILPCYWDEPEMQLYEKRQIDDIARFAAYPAERQTEARTCIEKHLSPALAQLEQDYQATGVAAGLIMARAAAFNEENFERVFVFDPRLSSDDIDKLVRTIRRQAQGGINTRAVSIIMNEKSTFRRPQDFGIALTSAGDLFGMFCDVDAVGNPQGGVIMRDKGKISRYLDSYLKIRGKSTRISQGSSESEVDRVLNELKSNPIDISDAEVYGNRCYSCLKRAEDVNRSDQWRHEESALRTFFQIYRDEHQALSDVLAELYPPSFVTDSLDILEIGCGPGRVIGLILDLVSALKMCSPSRIVGYDQNQEIAGYCTDEFTQNPTVAVHVHIVGLGPDGKYSTIRTKDKNRFDMIVAISNLVGWQDDKETEWLTDVIRNGLKSKGALFFTVYKRGVELERARMYKASGDTIELNSVQDSGQRDIVIVVDAFGGEKHKSKAYTEDQLEALLKEVQTSLASMDISIHWRAVDTGAYMWGRLVTASTKGA